MAKVTKNSVEVKITDLGGHEFTATDGDIKAGTLALQLFNRHETVEIKEEAKTTYIPYHAICHVEVTTTSKEEEFEDDTCVTEETPEEPTPDEPVEP